MTIDLQKPNQQNVPLDENYMILNIKIPRSKKYSGISQVDTLENKSLNLIKFQNTLLE